MAEPSLIEQVGILNSTLTAIEGRLARGQAPVEAWRISRARSTTCGCDFGDF